MTNEQKLAALRQGRIGSYNLASLDSSVAELAAFQTLAQEAYELAAAHGYFCRRDVVIFDGGRFVRGVLVTIPRSPSAQSRADAEIPSPPRAGRGNLNAGPPAAGEHV